MLSFRDLLLACLLPALPISAQAQSAAPDDEALIRATVQTYFDGWAVGDTAKLSAAMHSTCHLKSVNNGVFGARDKRSYLSAFKPRPKGDTQARILTLHRTGHAAAVVSQITSGPNRFTDYFNLLRINGRWFITDKVAIREELVASPK
ncbi:MAG: nuclear transport factor 2 family protein [Hymenobacter sp.]|nr:nuclear transport factor 2 family protein [Hymenobacter sp.]